jgi:hypothetical protein
LVGAPDQNARSNRNEELIPFHWAPVGSIQHYTPISGLSKRAFSAIAGYRAYAKWQRPEIEHACDVLMVFVHYLDMLVLVLLLGVKLTRLLDTVGPNPPAAIIAAVKCFWSSSGTPPPGVVGEGPEAAAVGARPSGDRGRVRRLRDTWRAYCRYRTAVWIANARRHVTPQMRNSAANLCTCRRSASRSSAEDPLVSHLSVILCRSLFSDSERIARSTTCGEPRGNACWTQQESSFVSRKFTTTFTICHMQAG